MKRCMALVFIAVLLAPAAVNAAPGETFRSPAQTAMIKLQWRDIGPFIGGRVVAIAGVPSEPNLFYMGGVEGGIWKSTDYGQEWTNISDGKLPGIADSIGALAVAPSNPHVIYAGTGESDIRSDFDTGDGIYKSLDAGKTWQYAGLRETHMTSSLVIDPRDPNIVYATSMGHVFKPNAQRGVFKTTDGGKTWRKILYIDDGTGANVIVMDPRNPSVLYATMWQAQRTAWNLTSGGPGSALYKTLDAGAHWMKISNNPGFAPGLLGKMGVSVSATDPHVVYAIVQAHDGGVFRSSDAGATWKRVNAEWKLRQRAFYYMAIYADPTNSNIAYAPQVEGVMKTTDGGKTWAPFTPAGDHHIIWVNPRNPKIILEGNDGGAMVSTDGGKTWSTENNQPTGQFYHIALDDQFPFHVYGAQQDEGAYEGPSASNEGLTLAAWHSVASGESTFVAPEADNPNVTYGAGYYSTLIRLNMATGTVRNVTPWPRYMSGSSPSETKYRFGWTHPIFFSPVNPHELFVAAQVVFKSDDYGATWQRISPDLTRNDKSTEGPSGGPIDNDQTGAETFPDISSLAVSPLSAQVMWAGSADGLVHVTTDTGATWHLVTPPSLPQWAQISSIEPSHVDRGMVYLTASRYMWDDFHPYVFKTVDYGAHWTQITQGLPDNQYVFAVRQDPREPRVLFAGTRSTVYVSLDGGARWQPLALNLPGVQVRDIAINAREGDVAIATHGRSFWILDNLKLIEQLAQQPDMGAAKPQLFAPETAWLTRAYGNAGPNPDAGQNPKYGATVFFDVPENYNGSVPVTLSFLDDRGKTVRSFSLHPRMKHAKQPSAQALAAMDHATLMARDLREATAIDPGMNAFQWDLTYPPATEVNGFTIPTTDDFSDSPNGPTIVPGTYAAVLNYGGKSIQQTFSVALDPRLHREPGALAARLAFATQIHDSIDALDRTLNAALAVRNRLTGQKREQLDRLIGQAVQLDIHSNEGDVLHETKYRDMLAFLMNELDGSYDKPTDAEYSTYRELMDEITPIETSLQTLTAASGR
ncbi:MAG: glycosyl hydrolase [Candidatus Eremiobacteraeota bacterium]|nr:glycosyl hydrolase [Candidatus Eremiobacteraeota bacterium]